MREPVVALPPREQNRANRVPGFRDEPHAPLPPGQQHPIYGGESKALAFLSLLGLTTLASPGSFPLLSDP